MKRNPSAWLSLFCAAAIATPALAAPFDGSQPFICAIAEMQMCAPSEHCEPQTAAVTDAPRFLRLSVANKRITGVRPSGTAVDAKIELIRHSGDTMFLQGTQEEFSWNLAIGQTTGDMSLTLSDGQDAAVAFGACTLR